MKKKDSSLWVFFETRIREFQINRQYATVHHYQSTKRSFQRFLNGREFFFGQLDHPTLLAYNEWLMRKGLQLNTISFYNRVLRALCNEARARGIRVRNGIFDGLYTRVAETRKRAIDIDAMQRVQRLDLSGNPRQALFRDLFLFSFMAQGMAFVDLAFLRREDLTDNILQYRRRKTGRSVSVYLEPEMMSIVHRHHRPDSPYLFPLLTRTDAYATYRQYQNLLTEYNLFLKDIAVRAGIRQPLSSYVARHSWASTALKCHIPVGVISEAMGHASEQTTRIYLSRLQTPAIALENRKVIRKLKMTGMWSVSR